MNNEPFKKFMEICQENYPLITFLFGKFIDFETPQHISDEAIKKGGSYPLDYDFKTNKVVYFNCATLLFILLYI